MEIDPGVYRHHAHSEHSLIEYIVCLDKEEAKVYPLTHKYSLPVDVKTKEWPSSKLGANRTLL